MSFIGMKKQKEIDDKKKNVLKEAEKNKTFQVSSGEEQDLLKLKEAGFSEDAITETLIARRQALNNKQITTESSKLITEAETSTDPANPEAIDVNIFEGKTKEEVTKQLFASGVTNIKTLQDVQTLYDLVMGTGEKTDKQIKQENFSAAETFIADNPGATRDELKAAMLQYTELDSTGIDALLNKSNIRKAEEMLSPEDAKEIATGLVKENTGLFANAEEGKQAAIDAVNDDATLNAAEKKMITDSIEAEYPGGRTLLQRILPWGK